MRAVNLIPSDVRKARGAAGKSGGGAYVLLAALSLMVVLMGVYVMTGNRVEDRKSEVAQLTRDADAAEAKANSLAAYTRFSDLRAKRVETVKQLAGQRFDWAHALHEVARVIPKDTWLTNLVGTVAPGVAVEGGGTQTGSLRSALASPAIEISGCTTSQGAVARMMARMRQIDGVQRVSLGSSSKGDAAGGDAGSGSDCRNGSDRFPRFELVVFFDQVAASTPAPAGQQPGTTAAALQQAAGNAQNPQTAPGVAK